MDFLKVNSYFFKYANSKDWILRNISFSLNKGETLLILGPNGSGKSTLALSLLGIAQKYPSEFKGEIIYKGKSILEYERYELAREISIVQQDPEAQIITLYVEDEVAFGLENLLYKDIEERISKALKLARIEHKRYDETYSLSYGEKQKVILASVLALDNELLILDEPTSNLDSLSRKEFFRILKDLKERNVSTIIIEHNVDEIAKFVDKVLVLNKRGELIKFGKFPDAIYELNTEDLEKLGIWLPFSLELKLFKKNKMNNKTIKNINEKVLEIKNLNFKYKKPVLNNINLIFEKGKLYSILGPNGAGKTTLCKIIAGLLKNQSGELRFYNPSSVRFCFQNPDVQFIGNTVLEELEISYKLSKNKKYNPIEILKTFGLEELSNYNPHMLSEGQKKMLTIALSLIYDPDILICDEPTFALDRYNARRIMGILRSLTYENKTVIFTTHDIRFALEYADHIIFLENGELKFNGHVYDFIKRIGELNIALPAAFESLNFEELRNFIIEIRGNNEI